MSWESAFAVLEPLSDWPAIRVAKLHALYELSRNVQLGCIVELGTFRGLGAIALALGASDGHQAPAYTIDDRTEKRGWAGEPYHPADIKEFECNLRRTGVRVQPVIGDVRAVAADWAHPVGLLVWDLGLRGRLRDDVLAWMPHLTPDGVVAVKDIEPPGFGRECFHQDTGWEIVHEYAAGFVFAYRRVLDRGLQPPRGGDRER